MMISNKIAITMGDPCGIGPEIIIKALNLLNINPEKIVLVGSEEIFEETAKNLNLKLNKNIEIYNIPCDRSKLTIGKPDIENGRVSFVALKEACNLANNNIVQSIVTAPLSKQAINMAGYFYSGQTEVLQEFLSVEKGFSAKAEMLFASKDMRVLLLTRHIELRSVSENIDSKKLIDSVQSLNNSLINDFGVIKPKIAICGLNPHSGEAGLIGKEENEIIIPAISKLRNELKIDIEGPFPADTIWVKAARNYFDNQCQNYDAYVACYHDQGLIPIKLMAMDSTVNITINLSKIRTSPSHGTAYDIAGKNIANFKSMEKSIQMAEQLTNIRHLNI